VGLVLKIHWRIQEFVSGGGGAKNRYSAEFETPQALGEVNREGVSIGSVNFGGRQFAGKYMYEKLTKCPNFTRYLPEKYFSRIWRQMSPAARLLHL